MLPPIPPAWPVPLNAGCEDGDDDPLKATSLATSSSVALPSFWSKLRAGRFPNGELRLSLASSAMRLPPRCHERTPFPPLCPNISPLNASLRRRGDDRRRFGESIALDGGGARGAVAGTRRRAARLPAGRRAEGRKRGGGPWTPVKWICPPPSEGRVHFLFSEEKAHTLTHALTLDGNGAWLEG